MCSELTWTTASSSNCTAPSWRERSATARRSAWARSRKPSTGDPDPKHISTSYVERQNLTMRMSMRPFTRLTSAFSKRQANHLAMLSIYFVWYNFCRIHKTLRVTPAVQPGLSETVRDVDWIVGLVAERDPKPEPRGPYKKRRQ